MEQFAERIGFSERGQLEFQFRQREPAEQQQPGVRLSGALRQVFALPASKKTSFFIKQSGSEFREVKDLRESVL